MKVLVVSVFISLLMSSLANAKDFSGYDLVFVHNGLGTNIIDNSSKPVLSEPLLTSSSLQALLEKEKSENELPWIDAGVETFSSIKLETINLRTINDTNFVIVASGLYYKTPRMKDFQYYDLDRETSCAVAHSDGSLLVLKNDTSSSQILRYAPDINAPEKLNKSVLFSTTGSLSSFDVDIKGKYIAYNREIEHDNFETVIQTISDGETIYRGRFNKTIFFIDAVGFYDAKRSSWYIASFPDFNILNTLKTDYLYTSPDRRFVFNPARFVVYESPKLRGTDPKGSFRPIRYLERIGAVDFITSDSQNVAMLLHTWYPEEDELKLYKKVKIWLFDKANPDGKVLWEQSFEDTFNSAKAIIRTDDFLMIIRRHSP